MIIITAGNFYISGGGECLICNYNLIQLSHCNNYSYVIDNSKTQYVTMNTLC